MLFVRYLLASFLIILLAVACSPEAEDLVPNRGIFGFSVNPASQTVSLSEGSVAGLKLQQTSDEPRTLSSDELDVASFNFAFLPGNVLKIEASFSNTSSFNFEQPFSFSSAPGTSNIVSSTEPSVSDADLGGDGVLSPNETTAVLSFEVEHNNEPFNYFVGAKAKVSQASVPEDPCDVDPNTVVNIPDEVLQAYVRRALRIPTGPITFADMQSPGLYSLTLDPWETIEDLEGLQFACAASNLELGGDLTDLSRIVTLANLPNLTYLRLDSNQIGDLSPLNSLINLDTLYSTVTQISDLSFLSPVATKIKRLFISNNQISDLSPLASFTQLTELDLGANQISDLSPLANLTSLTRLILGSNQISDISPLANLTNLSILSLTANQISDISPLASLTDVPLMLLLGFNQISDLSPLANLTNIGGELFLNNNQISDVSPLANLTNVGMLILVNNQISDISPLANLTDVTNLFLQNNQIDDVSPLTNLTNLKDLFLQNNQITDIGPLVDNSGLGRSDWIQLQENCLDLSEGSDDLANIQTLIARGAGTLDLSYTPQKEACTS